MAEKEEVVHVSDLGHAECPACGQTNQVVQADDGFAKILQKDLKCIHATGIVEVQPNGLHAPTIGVKFVWTF